MNRTNQWLQKSRQMVKQQQIQTKSIVSTIKNTAASNQDAKESNFSVSPCSVVPTTVIRLPEQRRS